MTWRLEGPFGGEGARVGQAPRRSGFGNSMQTALMYLKTDGSRDIGAPRYLLPV